jgi:hypothetical protein
MKFKNYLFILFEIFLNLFKSDNHANIIYNKYDYNNNTIAFFNYLKMCFN